MGRQRRLGARVYAYLRSLGSQRLARCLPFLRDVAVILLAIIAIVIAYRDYWMTDLHVTITSPPAGHVIMSREIAIDGAVTGGPFSGYEVLHKAPGDQAASLIRESDASRNQSLDSPFPISISLEDDDGALRAGTHTITVILRTGRRATAQDSVTFEVLDCALVIPDEFRTTLPIVGVVPLSPSRTIEGYDFIYFVDGIRWSSPNLDSRQLADGYHQLTVSVGVLGSDEIANSTTLSFSVDNSAPFIEALGASDEARVSGASILRPTIYEPHLSHCILSIDDQLTYELNVGNLEGTAHDEVLDYTLNDGWMASAADQGAVSEDTDEQSTAQLLADGEHYIVIEACDVNNLCSIESGRIHVDNTLPSLEWDLCDALEQRSFLPDRRIWLGAETDDQDARITYVVDPPASIDDNGYLDTTGCTSGDIVSIMAIAVDSAGNATTERASATIDTTPRAWLSTVLRGARETISMATAPISSIANQLVTEGVALGFGVEVSSSLADESIALWKVVMDFAVLEVCPVFGTGYEENRLLGVAIRVPLNAQLLASPAYENRILAPFLEFGASLTPIWETINSMDDGTESVAETWGKVAVGTTIEIPLGRQGPRLSFEWAPGLKLTHLQEQQRYVVWEDGIPIGMERPVVTSGKLEICIDVSVALLWE